MSSGYGREKGSEAPGDLGHRGVLDKTRVSTSGRFLRNATLGTC